jgi:putative nucleotidyltransferase with HDIG domain
VRAEAPLIRRSAHLASRFFGSFRPGEPTAADVAWVEALCTPNELALWRAMPRADRRESIAVARRAEAALASTPYAGDDGYLVAALLHDVGKTPARLGTIGRVAATLAGELGGRERFRGRIGTYLRHADVGAAMLRDADARPAAVEWAASHHDRPIGQDGTIPREVARILGRADGETESDES